jgi:hypothetical protein
MTFPSSTAFTTWNKVQLKILKILIQDKIVITDTSCSLCWAKCMACTCFKGREAF